jgi:putative flippase GtrA
VFDDDAMSAPQEQREHEVTGPTLVIPALAVTGPVAQIELPGSLGAPIGELVGMLAKARANFARLFRYGATSIVCLGISEATLLVLYAFGVNASLAAIAANLAGVLPSYLLSRYWIWHDADRKRVGRQLALYWATSVAALLVTSAATGVIADHAPRGALHLPFVGMGYLLVSVVLWVSKFVMYQRVIFSKPAAPAHDGTLDTTAW